MENNLDLTPPEDVDVEAVQVENPPQAEQVAPIVENGDAYNGAGDQPNVPLLAEADGPAEGEQPHAAGGDQPPVNGNLLPIAEGNRSPEAARPEFELEPLLDDDDDDDDGDEEEEEEEEDEEDIFNNVDFEDDSSDEICLDILEPED